MTDMMNPARAGSAAESGAGISLAADFHKIAPKQTPPQAVSSTVTAMPRATADRRHLHLVPRRPQARRLEVRIAAADGRAPYGRSRAFRLDEPDIERLVDFALRLEARRA